MNEQKIKVKLVDGSEKEVVIGSISGRQKWSILKKAGLKSVKVSGSAVITPEMDVQTIMEETIKAGVKNLNDEEKDKLVENLTSADYTALFDKIDELNQVTSLFRQ